MYKFGKIIQFFILLYVIIFFLSCGSYYNLAEKHEDSKQEVIFDNKINNEDKKLNFTAKSISGISILFYPKNPIIKHFSLELSEVSTFDFKIILLNVSNENLNLNIPDICDLMVWVDSWEIRDNNGNQWKPTYYSLMEFSSEVLMKTKMIELKPLERYECEIYPGFSGFRSEKQKEKRHSILPDGKYSFVAKGGIKINGKKMNFYSDPIYFRVVPVGMIE